MVYSGSLVTYGRAVVVITGTGMNTEIGKIAGLMNATKEKKTPLQVSLDKFSSRLAIIILAVCAVVFALSLYRKMPVIDSLMFAVALAVAAIPEALSSIVTIVQAMGTQKMARENAIIKELKAVESLGCVSVICSDKTGTLTQNKMTVQELYVGGEVLHPQDMRLDDKLHRLLLFDAALANVKLLSEAAALQGVEKAKALLKVYDSMPAGIADAEALRDEIAALDPENETGIHDELNVEKQREELIEKLQPVLDTDYAAALSIIDEAIATALPGNLEYFQALKLEVIQTNIIMDLGKVQTVEEVEAIKQRFLNEFVPLLPEEVQAEVKTQIEQEFADPAEVLKRIQASQQEQAEPQVQAPDLTEEEQAILLALQQKLQDCGQDVDAMLVIIDEALTTATPAQQQYLTPVKMMILMQKSQALLMAAETVEDIEAARVVSMQAVELLPEADKEEATRMMQETFADPEGLLQTLRLMREAQTPAAE